jgi:hypothetical protein
MSLFGKKRICKLEEEIAIKDRQIESLKSDLLELERENFELKKRYEPCKAPSVVKSYSSPFRVGDSKDGLERSNGVSSTQEERGRAVNGGFASGVMLGGAVAYLVSDAYSDNSSDLGGNEITESGSTPENPSE